MLFGGADADTFLISTVATGKVAVIAGYAAGTDCIGLTSIVALASDRIEASAR